MKLLNLLALAFICASLQPCDRKYSPCYSIVNIRFYKNGKLVASENSTWYTMYGDGIARAPIDLSKNKRIIADSIVFKIK